jgi:hypothetical protein
VQKESARNRLTTLDCKLCKLTASEVASLPIHGLHPRSLLDALLWLDSGDDEVNFYLERRNCGMECHVPSSKNLQAGKSTNSF